MICLGLEIITPFAVICQVKAFCLFFIFYPEADNGLDNFNDDVTRDAGPNNGDNSS